MGRRHLLISADCHAAARWRDYAPHLERQHVGALRGWCGSAWEEVPRVRPGEDRLFDKRFLDARDGVASVATGGAAGTWDPERRARELELDGIVGEVIFPGAENYGVPFHGRRPATGRPERQALELRWAGARAYNRWLAELCSCHPERRAGVAFVPLDEIEPALAEIRFARRAGLRGGIFLPAQWDPLPSYNHPRYEPVWALCADLGLPVNTHPLGEERESYGELPGATGIFLTEVKWFAHRPLTYLLWSGVFERHPTLRFVLTEQMADWVPSTLDYLDDLYTRPIFAQIRAGLPLLPSEYWKRQCYVGASFMVRKEVAMRREIGLRALMWGSDYPHAEGTWPYTRERLREAFAGVPEDEVALMVGGNAAKVYDFDLAKLAPLAERVGPEVEELGAPER
jgi:predicted TIM-barrel fold metal-dependent hydrolase